MKNRGFLTFSWSEMAAFAITGNTVITKVLTTDKEYSDFANLCNKKIDASTVICKSAYYKTVVERLHDSLSTAALNEIIEELTLTRTEQKKFEAASVTKTTKKAVKAKSKQHSLVFGGEDYEDDYGHYYN